MKPSSPDIIGYEQKTEITPRGTDSGKIDRRELLAIGGLSAAMLGVRAACRKLGLGKTGGTRDATSQKIDGGVEEKKSEPAEPKNAYKEPVALDVAPKLSLIDLQKRLLQENPDAVFDEGTGNVLIGRNKKIAGKKFERVTVDGVNFEVRKKADIAPEEQMVAITLGGKPKQFRKSFADLLLKVEADMKADYERYQANKKGVEEWIWRKRYETRMNILGSNGSKDHIAAADSFRKNAEQEEAYSKSLTGKTDEKGKPIQSFKVAPPGMSFHETGYAVDVDNWREVQYYMWKHGIAGGSRGLDEDPRHFSIREFKNEGLIRAGENRGSNWLRKHKHLFGL